MANTLPWLSTIARVPISYFVYSAFSFFGRKRGGELPGGWFIAALTDAGRDEAAIRQTLYRMEREGELIARRDGRMKFYRPSGYAAAEIDAGTEKIFDRPKREWDGQWTMVRVGLRTAVTAKQRERVIALLAVEGFVQLDANLFVHPRGAAERLLEALSPRARADVVVMRGKLLDAAAQPFLVSLWKVDELSARYRRVLVTLGRIDERERSGISDRDAFLMRFAVVFDYLAVAWEDPDLPSDVLPADWPGAETRAAAAALYERLLPAATRHADTLLESVLTKTVTSRKVGR
jgi:phenylacetic acid degradation operon negative regulatory protein